jgi:hypothetical protein
MVDGNSATITVLKACGNDATHESIMKQAASIHDLKLPMLLRGITVSTSADDFAPIKQMQLKKFDGNAGSRDCYNCRIEREPIASYPESLLQN